jgi:nicotinamidase-related amidase
VIAVCYASNMSQPNALPRSPELMSRTDTGLLVVDMQGKLLTLVPGHRRMTWNIRRLIDAAQLLGLPVAATEQYPQGLGPTTPDLAPLLGSIPSKQSFSCGQCGEVFERFEQVGVHKLLIVGIEAHVCVAQTVFDVLAAGWRAYLAVDAIGSRAAIDSDIALRRMESAGATLTTTEAALFEWCQTAGTPEFKQISQLVREAPPE